MLSLKLLVLIKNCGFITKQTPSIGLPVKKLIVNHRSVPRNLRYCSPYCTFKFALTISDPLILCFQFLFKFWFFFIVIWECWIIWECDCVIVSNSSYQEFTQNEIFGVPKKNKTNKTTTKSWEFVSVISRNECIWRELIFVVCKKSIYFNLTSINYTKIIFFVEHYNSFALKSHICLIVHTLRRPYSRPLLGATIAPSLVPLILKKIFSLEMVRKCALKKRTHAPIYRIGPVTYSVAEKNPIFWQRNKSVTDDRKFEKYAYEKIKVNNPCRHMMSLQRL